MKSEEDIKYCLTDGIPNEHLANPKLAEEQYYKVNCRNLDKFININTVSPDLLNTGYESPITMIASQIETKVEGDVLQAVQRVGIDVNKEELLKALQYDREQYNKGYHDGYVEGYAKAIEDCIAKLKG